LRHSLLLFLDKEEIEIEDLSQVEQAILFMD